MANIRKMDPSRQVSRRDPFDSPFEDFFRGLFVRPMSFGAFADEPQFRVDVSERDQEFVVHAELPGVRKEDINVTIDGDEVAISAEARRESEVKGEQGRTLRTERFAGRMYRAFSLGHEVDEAKAEAKYVDGVLELKLPKKAPDESTRKQIKVH